MKSIAEGYGVKAICPDCSAISFFDHKEAGRFRPLSTTLSASWKISTTIEPRLSNFSKPNVESKIATDRQTGQSRVTQTCTVCMSADSELSNSGACTVFLSYPIQETGSAIRFEHKRKKGEI